MIKYECVYCGKIIKNPLMDFDKNGKPYPFCNKKCKDAYVKDLLDLGFVLNPIGCFILICVITFEKLVSLVKLMFANKK